MRPSKTTPASKPRPGPARQRGAALLLLLTLAGVGAATLLVSALGRSTLEARRQQLTVRRLGLATEALLGYASTHGRLPRPAVSATDGNERAQTCDSEDSCTGLLPWVTLGIDGSDAWGKRLRYSVTPEYTQAPVRRISAVATKTVQTRSNDGQLYYLVGQSDCTLAAPCAPAVVLSHGKDNFGYSEAGVPQPNSGKDNADELLNALAAVHFVARPATDDPHAPGGAFDDQLAALSLSRLYKQMSSAHKLP